MTFLTGVAWEKAKTVFSGLLDGTNVFKKNKKRKEIRGKKKKKCKQSVTREAREGKKKTTTKHMASGKRPKPQPPTALPNANSPRRVWEVLGYCVSRGSSWSLSIVARARRCCFVFIFIMIVSLKEGRRYVNAPPSSLLLLNATLSIPTSSDSKPCFLTRISMWK